VVLHNRIRKITTSPIYTQPRSININYLILRYANQKIYFKNSFYQQNCNNNISRELNVAACSNRRITSPTLFAITIGVNPVPPTALHNKTKTTTKSQSPTFK
jgi:hypothetical protein